LTDLYTGTTKKYSELSLVNTWMSRSKKTEKDI
jgi:hypothetical protein